MQFSCLMSHYCVHLSVQQCPHKLSDHLLYGQFCTNCAYCMDSRKFASSHCGKLEFTGSVEIKLFRVGYFVNSDCDFGKLFYVLKVSTLLIGQYTPVCGQIISQNKMLLMHALITYCLCLHVKKQQVTKTL